MDPQTRLMVTIAKMLNGEEVTTGDIDALSWFFETAKFNVVSADQNRGLQSQERFRLAIQQVLEATRGG